MHVYIIAINGSPRKNGNTAALLNKALEGASSQGATTEMINLYDLNFKGCMSCFACKLKALCVRIVVVQEPEIYI